MSNSLHGFSPGWSITAEHERADQHPLSACQFSSVDQVFSGCNCLGFYWKKRKDVGNPLLSQFFLGETK